MPAWPPVPLRHDPLHVAGPDPGDRAPARSPGALGGPARAASGAPRAAPIAAATPRAIRSAVAARGPARSRRAHGQVVADLLGGRDRPARGARRGRGAALKPKASAAATSRWRRARRRAARRRSCTTPRSRAQRPAARLAVGVRELHALERRGRLDRVLGPRLDRSGASSAPARVTILNVEPGGCGPEKGHARQREHLARARASGRRCRPAPRQRLHRGAAGRRDRSSCARCWPALRRRGARARARRRSSLPPGRAGQLGRRTRARAR